MSILGGAIITLWMGAGAESSMWFALVPGFDAVRNTDLQISCQSICASFAGLPSVPVQFAVEAYGRRGVTSAKMAVLGVDLAHPGDVAHPFL